MNSTRLAVAAALCPLFASIGFSAPVPLGDPLPSLVKDAGWPSGATGNVLDVRSLRFTTPHEGEFVFLIDDDLYLAYRPGRYASWFLLEQNVTSVAVLPQAGATDKLFVNTTEGPKSIQWKPATQSADITPLTSTLDSWNGVSATWVQERPGALRVYGYDAGQGKVKRADCVNGVWMLLTPVTPPNEVLDFRCVELDSTHFGEELVWRGKYQMSVTADDGTTVLSTEVVRPTDSIEVVRGFAETGGDALVWTYLAGGTHKIKMWNQGGSSVELDIGAQDCSSIMPRTGPNHGNHLLLTRGGSGQIDILEVLPGTGGGWASLSAPVSGDHFVTHASGNASPIALATTGDVDLDDQADVAVVVQGSGGHEIRYVHTANNWDQRLTTSTYAMTLNNLGNDQYSLGVTMDVGSGVASQDVWVELWATKDPSSSSSSQELIYSGLVAVPAGATSYTFTLPFDGAGWAPTDGHYVPSFTPVDVNSAGAWTGVHPTFYFTWADAQATIPAINSVTPWVNSGDPNGDDDPIDRPVSLL